MKRNKLALMLGVLMMASMVRGAADDPMATKEQITKEAMRANKKALVAHNMEFTPDQEKKFWPMYDEFQIEINKLDADREALIKKFALNYNGMTDDLATELTNRFIDLQKKRVDLHKKLVDDFSRKFPPKVVARYLQIENKVDTALLAHIEDQIPLMK